MMYTAKIYQYRHEIHHSSNKTLVEIEEWIDYKIVFSHPVERIKFEKWMKDNKGLYKFNKDTSRQEGKLPIVQGFKKGDYCFCDIFTYYLLHVADYLFKDTVSPYKAEIYYKHI